MKYKDGYNDGVQEKPSRHPLSAVSLHADQGKMEVLISHAPSMPFSSATTTVIGTSRDYPVSSAHAESQFAEACQDSEVDPASGATEAPHRDILSV